MDGSLPVERMPLSLFGTDGVRGRVGIDPIIPSTILKLGWAIGKTLNAPADKGAVLIGKDTRLSGYMLESVLEAGLCSAGMDIALVGPLPTPGIAYLTRHSDACAGIVISGSHNPYPDNGIKIFDSVGDKLNDESLAQIELMMAQPPDCVAAPLLGKASRMIDARDRYINYCKKTIDPITSLEGLNVVLDCANGAAYDVAPRIFSELGVNLTVINAEPDGFNINQQCGSTDLRALQAKVLEEKADLGIAFDGDADRVLMVDEHGNKVTGDQILYILARYRQGNGKTVEGVVGTILSNMALEESLQALGIPFVRTQVGDRFVQEAMIAKKWMLGGEASGHIIGMDKSTTGDGIVYGLEVLAAVFESGQSLGQLVEGIKPYPQHTVDIPIKPDASHSIEDQPVVQAAVLEVEKLLAKQGRIVLRASGTEPLFRVMLEGRNVEQLEKLADKVVKAIKQAISR